MLDKLPAEIILTISNFLTLEEKLILITTCRLVFDLISKTSLFSNINLYSRLFSEPRGRGADRFMEKFKRSGYSGSQVKILSIDLDSISPQFLGQLPTLLPNVTRITTIERDGFMPPIRRHIGHRSLLPWANSLEVYIALDDWSSVLPVLKTTPFPRLTELQLTYIYNAQDKAEGFDIPHFLPYIKNTPALKRLELSGCVINLEFLEEVHASCPRLETLVLDQTSIIIRNQTLTQPVVPANSVLSLKVCDAFCFDENGLFLDYITRKYRCLKWLKLTFNTIYQIKDFLICYWKIGLIEYVRNNYFFDRKLENNPKLEEYQDIHQLLSTEFRNTLIAYEGYGHKFFSNLTTSTKSIIILANLFDNAAQALANSSMEPVRLVLFGGIKDTRQLEYTKNIKGLRSLELTTNFKYPSFNHYFPSVNITQLTVRTYTRNIRFGRIETSYMKQREPTPINWILSTFPSVEKLYIDGGVDLTATENGVSKRFPSLKEFYSKRGYMNQAFFDYLKTSTPHLQDITIQNSALCIDISNWELKRLNVISPNKSPFYCYITVPERTKLVKYDPSEQSLAAVNKKLHFKMESEVIRIVATKEKHFEFNGFPISLSHDKITIDV